MPGVNRFVWELRYPPPASLPYSYYGELLEYTEYTLADHSIPSLTPRQQLRGPRIVPGKYTVELAYGDDTAHTLRQPLTVDVDPRVHASREDLLQQRDLALEITRGMKSSYDSFQQVVAFDKALAERKKGLQTDDAEAKKAFEQLDKKIDAFKKGTKTAPGFGPVNRDFGRLLFSVENADMRPAQAVQSAVQQLCEALVKNLADWRQFNEQDFSPLAKTADSKLSALPRIVVVTGGCKN